MSSSNPPPSSIPPSMGPGAHPIRPGESPGTLLKEIADIRSHYNVHVDSSTLNLSYEIKGQERHYRLPFDNIPLQGIMRSWLWSSRSTARASGILVIDMIRASENISGRPLTQQEAESFAFYSSKRMMTTLSGQLIGIGIGYAVAWRGRAEMKFPFMKPKPAEQYQTFPSRWFPVLKGQAARIMWQITRANIYAAIGIFAVVPFARSMADSSMTVGLYRDPRTHELLKTMKGGLDRLQSNRARSGAQRTQPQPEQSDTSYQGGIASTGDGSDQQTFYGNTQNYSSQQDYSSDSFTDGNTDTEVMNDQMSQRQQARQASPSSWGKKAAPLPSPSQGQNRSQSSSSDFFFNDDDASPTAGNDPDMSSPNSYRSQNSGSVWDSIRKGRQTQTTKQSQQQRQTPAGWQRSSAQDADNNGDSFAFSKSSEDRQLAKEQAQKDFDAMLDRERQEGGSFEYTKDMQATGMSEASKQSTGSAWERRRRG